jgi:hypothetical protein
MILERFSTLYYAYGGFFPNEEAEVAKTESNVVTKSTSASLILPSAASPVVQSSPELALTESETVKQPLGFDLSAPTGSVQLSTVQFGVLCALAGAGTALLFVHLLRRKLT